jgi:hypothetical protein
MRRVLLLFLLFLVVVAALGILALGVFPPEPHQQTVEKVLPNDKLAHPQ